MSIATIGIELTNACNLRCKHCLRDFSVKPRFLQLSFIERILKEAKVFGTEEISFTGGEPTLHPELEGIIELLTSHNYKYSLITNALEIDPIIAILSKSKEFITRIGVSLDGSKEETNDFNRGKGSFRKIISSIIKLKDYGIPVMLQMCIGKFNKSELEQMALFASHLGVDELFFAHILPVSDGKEDLSLAPAVRIDVEDIVYRLAGELKIPIHFSVGHSVSFPLYNCVTLSMHRINIDFNGYLTFCCQISNYRGVGSSKNNPDFVADLNRVSLREGIKRLLKSIHNFQLDRIKNLNMRKDNVHFPCDYCIRYFKKGVVD